MTEPTWVWQDVAPYLTRASRIVVKRLGRWVEHRDLVQEGWAWCYDNPEQVQTLLAEPWKLVSRLRTVLDRHGRRVKAASAGYDPQDEQFYSLPQLRAILPDALDPNATAPGAPMDDAKVATSATSGEWETALADVRAGLSRIADSDLTLLTMIYRDHLPTADIAAWFAIGESTVYVRAERALARLRDVLGGANPWRAGDSRAHQELAATAA